MKAGQQLRDCVCPDPKVQPPVHTLATGAGMHSERSRSSTASASAIPASRTKIIDLILGYRVPPRRCTAAGSLRSLRRIRCARHWCGHWALGIPVRSAAEKVFEWRHWMILSSTTVLKCVFHETGPRNQLSPVHWILLSQLKASIINGCYRAADYTVARCPSVHLYVCHTPVYSIETARHVIRLFSPSGSHTIGLVFKRLTLR